MPWKGPLWLQCLTHSIQTRLNSAPGVLLCLKKWSRELLRIEKNCCWIRKSEVRASTLSEPTRIKDGTSHQTETKLLERSKRFRKKEVLQPSLWIFEAIRVVQKLTNHPKGPKSRAYQMNDKSTCKMCCQCPHGKRLAFSRFLVLSVKTPIGYSCKNFSPLLTKKATKNAKQRKNHGKFWFSRAILWLCPLNIIGIMIKQLIQIFLCQCKYFWKMKKQTEHIIPGCTCGKTNTRIYFWLGKLCSKENWSKALSYKILSRI